MLGLRMTAFRHQRLLPLVTLAVLAGAAFYARSRMGLEWNVESVRAFVAGLGFWGPLAFVLLLGFRMLLLIPSKILLVVGGICFGLVEGSLYGALGIVLSGVLAFGLTRWLGVERLRSQVPPRARRTLELAGSRGGAGLMGLATGYPIGPLTIYHVGAALTSMPFVVFLVALCAGALVRAGLYAWFGEVLATGGLTEMALAGGVLALAALPLLHPRVRGWFREQIVETETDRAAPPPA